VDHSLRDTLLGAVYGLDAVPARWVDRLLNCRPEAGRPGVHHPRPEVFWPVDVMDLATHLVSGEHPAGAAM
jgi:hypothetical protein